ncbi:MAG: TAT-variant-translocated molybdopterin oxidoreductase [Planctomycetota bacterium]
MSNATTTTDSAVASRPRYFRSMSELSGDPQMTDYLEREFPVAASEFPEGVSRRRWLQLMGASLAMAGVAGCRYPEEIISPFVLRPEGYIPGETYEAASNFEIAGDVIHALIECVDGRPLRVAANTSHPIGGATGAYAHATVLTLYDPDRARGETGVPIKREAEGGRRLESTWDAFDRFASGLVRSSGDGKDFAVLMGPSASPTLVRSLQSLQEQLPSAEVVVYDPIDGGAMHVVGEKLFGKPVTQAFDFTGVETVVALQADFLGTFPGSADNGRTFGCTRDPNAGPMSRLYVVEGDYSATGAAADVRLALRPSQIPSVLAELTRRVQAGDSKPSDATPEALLEMRIADEERIAEGGDAARQEVIDRDLETFIASAAADLIAAGEHGVVIVGTALGADAVVAGVALNQALGSYGKIQKFRPTAYAELKNLQTMSGLASRISKGDINALVVLDANVVHTAPSELALVDLIDRVEHSIYLGMYDDETAAKCVWSLPLAHPLESWSDCVGVGGHYGVCQPQILPLLGGRTMAEVIATMAGMEVNDGQGLVQETANELAGGTLPAGEWKKLLYDGYHSELTVEASLGPPNLGESDLAGEVASATLEIDKDAIEVLFLQSEALYDGRFANNGWLQEMPQSLTKLTWGNAAVMSPRTAKSFGVKHGLMLALRRDDGTTVELPVYEMPGMAPGVVTATIGYGRSRVGMVGGLPEEEVEVVGINVAPIRHADSMQFAIMEGRPRFNEYELATTQDHWAIDELGRDETEDRSYSLIREGTTALLDKLPDFTEALGPHVPKVGQDGSLWEEPISAIEEAKPHLPQWGMSIDLTKCTGCNACVIACQAENNVPIVGKEQVINSREMHWIRIDRYFQGDEDDAEVVQLPLSCVHCETAPCEQVCPVAATVHTDEGINAMAYNRCIGTRYCANNCPYKVRRFNYFNYNKDVGVGYGIDAYPGSIETANRKLQSMVLNPEVTVRGRGVMEKCTYCVQRIERAKINARKEGGRPIKDGDIVTACQNACPCNAVEFGNIADPESRVSKAKKDKRSYGMLTQLNTKPRTTYLARIRNTPPALMTRVQLDRLVNLEAPHHGHHDGHGHDEHGHDERGHDEHGHDDHHDDHEHDEHHDHEHGDDAKHARLRRRQLPIV